MNLELLFGLLLLAFVALWAFWMFAISKGSRTLSIGIPIGMAALLAVILTVNGERGEEEKDDYRAHIERFIDAVAAAQDDAYAESGKYLNEVPDLPPELLEFDDGSLQQEEPFETSVSAEESGYTVSGTLGDQSYTLQVENPPKGTPEENRSCAAAESAGCVNDTWEPAS